MSSNIDNSEKEEDKKDKYKEINDKKVFEKLKGKRKNKILNIVNKI